MTKEEAYERVIQAVKNTWNEKTCEKIMKALEQEPKTDQWQELKETITELRDNDGTATQQEVCKFLVNYMEVLEKQMQEPKTDQWQELKETLIDGLERLVFFNKRAGRELWSEKPIEVQNKDIADAEEILQSAIKAIKNGILEATKEVTIMTQEDYERAIKVLQKHNQELIAERLKQKPKTGHWKRISMDKYTTHAQYWYECDKCGEHNLGNTNYCPKCGARMVEPQESEE